MRSSRWTERKKRQINPKDQLDRKSQSKERQGKRRQKGIAYPALPGIIFLVLVFLIFLVLGGGCSPPSLVFLLDGWAKGRLPNEPACVAVALPLSVAAA